VQESKQTSTTATTKASLTLREMLRSDIEGVVSVENICFVDPFPRDSFDYVFTQTHKQQHAFVLSTGKTPLEGVVVGYVMVECGEQKAEILSIAVRPDFRGQGGAATLLKCALQTAKDLKCNVCSLHVLVSNVTAQRVYTKLGFHRVARAQYYYGTSDGPQKGDALVMECKLVEQIEGKDKKIEQDVSGKKHGTLLQCPLCESSRCTYSSLSLLVVCDDCDHQWEREND